MARVDGSLRAIGSSARLAGGTATGYAHPPGFGRIGVPKTQVKKLFEREREHEATHTRDH
jgi:hypothetical protein